MNKASDEMSHSTHYDEQGQEMVSTDESSASMPMPPSFEQQQETLTIITQDFFANQMMRSQIIEHHLNAICNIPDLDLGQNQIHVLAKHIAEMNYGRNASFEQLKHICTSIYDQDITSELLSESQEDADSVYNEWASTNLEQQQTAQWPEPAARKSLTSHTPLSDEESQKTSANDSVSMSRDSMSTEGDDCQSLNKSCKRRLIYSSEQQKKRSRRTATDSDANTSNRAFAQKEKELERRREEIEIRETALAEKEKQLSQQRQAAAEESSRKMTLEEKTRLEHQQKLDMATAEAEKRLLQIQQVTKVEAERLEKIQQAKAEAERKAEDNKFKEARVIIERRLVDSRTKIEGLSRRLDTYHVVVVAVSLLDAVIRKVEDALDPRNPNLALIPKITNDFIIILQVIARYKKMLGKFTTKKEAESIDTLLDINVHQSIGAIAARIEKNKADKEEAINYQVLDSVKHLKNALHRFETGNDTTIEMDSQITSRTEINRMKAAFPFDQAAENLLLNCIHISLMVYVEESLTVEQLFENHGDKGLRQAEDLWKSVLSGVPFNAKETSMLEFRQKVLLPALANEKSREDAFQVNSDFANYLADLRIGGRKEIVQPALYKAQRKRFDGSDAEECKEDYCAGSGSTSNKRRSKMTIILANLSAPDAIQERLPGDLFPCGLRRALLLNSSSFCKESCNFVSRGGNNKPGFFDRGHDVDETVKRIREKLKYRSDVGEKNIIIDREEKEKVIGSLKSLFG